MRSIKHLYQHFTEEDREFVDKSLEKMQRVEDSYSFEVTSFVNPHQVEILRNLGNHLQLQIFSSSDYYTSELAKVIIAPLYYELQVSDFEIDLLEISYANKFHHLTHSQIMGTVLNQLGIERKVFGDILVASGRAQIMVDRKFTQFFIDHISRIAKTSVKLKQIDFSQLIAVQADSKLRDVLVSSMRLDKVLAASFRLSRSVATKLIATKQVRVNYSMLDNPSHHLLLNDLISVRGYGRVKVLRENGFSKNGKYKLTVELLSSK
ncbi:YlmH family RNA-binding protein [Streptococcus constellatus]|uniref:YlmH family RNA-binding protein n=1 Tax=Streptococcus constellatus TaxID=76860 RepID=UPI0012392475|nr:YlmH/Sll1252 family protein [Streptococcus constellatus]